MSSVRIELNKVEVSKLLHGEGQYEGVRRDLHERGERIAQAAGGDPDFEVEDVHGHDRARVHVVTATPKAMVEEAQNRTLTRALDAGR